MKRPTQAVLKRLGMVAATGLCLALMPGCGNPVDKMLADEALRTQLMEKVTGSPDLSGQLVDRLLGADSTRAQHCSSA